jgi:N-acetylmuramoyl-L-alanine amidase
MRCLMIALGLLIGASAVPPAEARLDPRGVPAEETDVVRLMALNMYREARGDGRAGMLAVGWVVLNRMQHPDFPTDIRSVILEGLEQGRCQFSWACDDSLGRARDDRSWRTALELAEQLLSDRPPGDPTFGALWFRVTALGEPSWGELATTVVIGGHAYFAEELTLRPSPPRPRLPSQRLAMSSGGSGSSAMMPNTMR